jgi:hypothetical protein
MAGSLRPDLLRQVWEYPLFDALYGRRSRRFGLGFEMAEGPTPYQSHQSPAPLSEDEEALLVAAGVGFSGIALWDQSRPLPGRFDGRTFASPTRGRSSRLFFTNDRGVYLIDKTTSPALKMQTAETPDDRKTVLDLYRESRRELQPGRLGIPRRVPPLCGHNLWDSNMPGSTLFMPVCDVSLSLIALIAQFVDPRLGHFALGGHGAYIVDDRQGLRPAGTEEWLRDGLLDETKVLTLSHLERQACYFTFSEPAVICHNMFLATEAMGIGGWMYCGFLSREIFEVLGFRLEAPNGVAALAHPVGLDGVFEAYCPPYFATMDAAVDAVLTPLLRASWTAGDHSTGQQSSVPYLMTGAERREGCVEISAEGIACTKAVCNYILGTYGRFPGTVDAMHLMWFLQAHHLDTGYYDGFFRRGAYGPTHAAHMKAWHGL